MDAIKVKALELAAMSMTAPPGEQVARAEAYERFLRNQTVPAEAATGEAGVAVGSRKHEQVRDAKPIIGAALSDLNKLSVADRVYIAQERLIDALATESDHHDRVPPTLRDLLNTDMPQWLALAAHAEMMRQGSIIANATGFIDHVKRWARFMRSVANQAGTTNGVRFPPDL